MKTIIYYFTGTGNTLVLAKRISQEIDAPMVGIPSLNLDESLKIDAERIIVVFPAYLSVISGFPLLVEKFIASIENLESLQVNAVCNCGGNDTFNSLPSLNRFRQVVEAHGGQTHGEFSLRLPMNNLDYDHIPIPIETDSAAIIQSSVKSLDIIIDRIRKGKGTKNKLLKKLLIWSLKPFVQMMRKPISDELRTMAQVQDSDEHDIFKLIPLTDRSIQVDERCNGCGICEKVCPVKNICAEGSKPEFQHHCEMCFACDEWCPQGAITHWSRKKGVKYHHPEVKLKDILKQKTV